MRATISRRRVSSISCSLMLILLAINSFTGYWWPYIYITIGAPLFIKQLLTGRVYDSIVSLSIFGGLFLVSNFSINWTIILPVVFIMSAIMILFREFCNPYAPSETESEINISIENTEDNKKR